MHGHHAASRHHPAVARPRLRRGPGPSSSRQNLPAPTGRSRSCRSPLIRSVRERVDYAGKICLRARRGGRAHQHARAGRRRRRGAGRRADQRGGEPRRTSCGSRRSSSRSIPPHLLGAIPMLLVAPGVRPQGRVRARARRRIVDAFLHQTMYHALSAAGAEPARRTATPSRCWSIHNSGGMAQLNSTDALQTIHSGPVVRRLGQRASRETGRPRQRRRHRHGRHQLRHRPGPGRRGQALRLHAGDRPLAGQSCR